MAGRLRSASSRSAERYAPWAAEAVTLQRRLCGVVNQAYGLTPDEVAMMWHTVPPRMPFGWA